MIRQPLFGARKRGAQTGKTKTLPAPTGGWNTRDNVANMPVNKATVLDNWFPQAANVVLRSGCVQWATGLPSTPRSLFQYAGKSSSKMFAACNTGIYDVTAQGAVGGVAAALTNGYCGSVMFDNVAGHYLIVVNGTDSMWRYDGTTWTSVAGAITGVATNTLFAAHAFKKKLWFLQNNSMSAWYLATSAIIGAATEFPLGTIFTKGGYLVAMGTWTIDGGSGMDDQLVFVSSEGELAVYKGTDPDVSTAWALVGVFYLGEPLGKRCLTKYGGDLLYLSQNGLFPLSKALLSTSINYHSALSDEIGPTFADHSSLYRNNEGWQPFVHPQGSALIVNVPISVGARIDQFVMNTVNQAWCRFKGWTASCWAMMEEEAYFASGTSTYKSFSGTSDAGANIPAIAQQAYSYLDSRAQTKHVKMLRPLLKSDQAVNAQLAVSVDFNDQVTYSQAAMPAVPAAVFDSSTFDNSYWGADLLSINTWRTVAAPEGYCAAVLLRVETNNAKVIWNATDVLFTRGGVL